MAATLTDTIRIAVSQQDSMVGDIDGNLERALKVFQLNARRHPDTWPVNYGLARIYSAMGEYERALGYLRQAAKEVPEGDSLNAEMIARNTARLERGEDINQ